MSAAKALFVNNSTNTVWVTDGTSSGTFQLPVSPDLGYSSQVLSTGGMGGGAEDTFPVFGNKLLFVETESGRNFAEQIYVTDGTVAGTSEVTVPDPNPGVDLLDDGSKWVAQFGNKALFLDGVTSQTGQQPTVQFLVTDGTAPGTSTFTIAGPPLGLSFNPGPFASFGNLVLFSATDYSGLASLWVSNGTAAGTAPLAINGANTSANGPVFAPRTSPSSATKYYSTARIARVFRGSGLQTVLRPARTNSCRVAPWDFLSLV